MIVDELMEFQKTLRKPTIFNWVDEGAYVEDDGHLPEDDS
jgi:hypothetical protein